MRPVGSNTPADRSPASRTAVEKAVWIRVCACSSTTAIRRFHMICMWMAAVGSLRVMTALQHDVPEAIDMGIERRRHDRCRLGFGDNGGAGNAAAGFQRVAPMHRHILVIAQQAIEQAG